MDIVCVRARVGGPTKGLDLAANNGLRVLLVWQGRPQLSTAVDTAVYCCLVGCSRQVRHRLRGGGGRAAVYTCEM